MACSPCLSVHPLSSEGWTSSLCDLESLCSTGSDASTLQVPSRGSVDAVSCPEAPSGQQPFPRITSSRGCRVHRTRAPRKLGLDAFASEAHRPHAPD